MNCPRCNNLLVLSYTQGVEIDHCPACKGVWLDRGELEKIIERTQSYYSPDGQIDHQTRHHDEHDDHGYKSHDGHREQGQYPQRRKGFLSELFDF